MLIVVYVGYLSWACLQESRALRAIQEGLHPDSLIGRCTGADVTIIVASDKLCVRVGFFKRFQAILVTLQLHLHTCRLDCTLATHTGRVTRLAGMKLAAACRSIQRKIILEPNSVKP